MQPMFELAARKDIVGVVERRHIRYAHMVGVTPEIMQQGMRADYTMVDKLSERLLQRMHSARSLTVRTDAGTTLVASFDAALDLGKDQRLDQPALLVQFAGGRSFHYACEGGRHICL